MRKLTRGLELGASCLLGYALLDPARVIAYSLLLRRMREQHPELVELFDGVAAGASVDGALADARALLLERSVAVLPNLATAA